jgi:sodium/potassium-transporting ATPase subunit alpha
MVTPTLTGLLSFITYAIYPTAPVNLYLGLLLMGDVLITCYLSFSQEAKSAAVMESFRVMLPSECTVTRSGKRQRTLAEDLVVGDLVMLKTGDKVPADLRIIYCNGLMVDQSMLTGESEPQPKSEARFAEKNPLESMNLAFSGSLCVDGEAAGIVVRTGTRVCLRTYSRSA